MAVEIMAHGCKACSRQGALKLKIRGWKWRRGNGARIGKQELLRTPTGPDPGASLTYSPRQGRIKEYHKII